MDRELRILIGIAIVILFFIGIGYGISMVRLDNQERVSRIVQVE
jgi:hypothetical protein